MPYVLLSCQVLLALVFLVSATGKLRPAGVRALRRTLRELGVPARLVPVTATATIAAEATAGLLVLPTPTARCGLIVAALLLVALTTGVARAVIGRRTVSCACFGPRVRPLRGVHLVRNGALLLATGCALALLPAAGPAHAEVLALSIATGALGALVLIGLDDVRELLFPSSASGRPAGGPG
ncbi:MauE/DoxX family redox-associated membrane protein [Streptomyces xiamenensis]